MQRVLIVLPSYNESKNIVAMVNALLDLKGDQIETYVCIVDDNSPDGTPDVLANEKKADPVWQERVTVHIRDKKDGRGGAVRHGLEEGLQTQPSFEFFVEMDCDFSHPPPAVLKGVALLNQGNDVVIPMAPSRAGLFSGACSVFLPTNWHVRCCRIK